MLDHYAKKTASWEAEADSASKPAPQWALLIAVGAIAAVAVTAAAFVMGRNSKPTVFEKDPEVNAVAVVGPQRVRLIDHPGGPTWLTLYNEYQDLLGEPLAGEQPVDACLSAVIFLNYVICHVWEPSVRGSQWEYPPAVLGSTALPAGVRKDVDAPLAPIVKAYIDTALTSKGRDWLYWLGRPISHPYCNQTGQCFQALERQMLHWPDSPTAGPMDVRLSPLGLNLKDTQIQRGGKSRTERQ